MDKPLFPFRRLITSHPSVGYQESWYNTTCLCVCVCFNVRDYCFNFSIGLGGLPMFELKIRAAPERHELNGELQRAALPHFSHVPALIVEDEGLFVAVSAAAAAS